MSRRHHARQLERSRIVSRNFVPVLNAQPKSTKYHLAGVDELRHAMQLRKLGNYHAARICLEWSAVMREQSQHFGGVLPGRRQAERNTL